MALRLWLSARLLENGRARVTGDGLCGATLAGRYHDEELDDIVVDSACIGYHFVGLECWRMCSLAAPTLYDENILITN